MAKNSKKVQKTNSKENSFKLLADNRYAKFQYTISETIEAGIELLGTEVKSIRNGKVNLRAVSYTHLTLPTTIAV